MNVAFVAVSVFHSSISTVYDILTNVVLLSRYKYDWKIEEAQKNILRTHTTAVSARMLYKLAQQVSCTNRFNVRITSECGSLNVLMSFWTHLWDVLERWL